MKNNASVGSNHATSSWEHSNRSQFWLATVLVAINLLLLSRGYFGIWHDSTLYLGQALALLYPESFRHDLFFAYGSQASYTIAPQLLAPLLARFDVGAVFYWLTLAAQISFVVCSAWLIRTVLPPRMQLAGLIGLVLLPQGYGAENVLSYAEPFFTARSLAEPLVLGALAALIGGRYWLSFILLAIAGSLHPVQALPGAVISWLWLARHDARWYRLAWAIPTAVVACFLIPQCRGLLTVLDPAWYDQVALRDPLALYFSSGPSTWYNLLTNTFIVAVGAHAAKGKLRHFLFVVLWATLSLSTASWILTDLLHLAWPAAMQFWRVAWLTHWVAMATLPWICAHIWHEEPTPKWPRLLLFASLLLLGLPTTTAHPLTPGIMLLFIAWPSLGKHMGQSSLKLLSTLVFLFACFSLLQIYAPALMMFTSTQASFSSTDGFRALTFAAILLIAIPFLFRWPRMTAYWRGIGTLLIFVTLICNAVQWDQRIPMQRAITRPPYNERPFGVTMQPTDQVLWFQSLSAPWILLHQPSYMNSQQMAGLVFNRGTAIEGTRRKNLLHVLDGRGNDCRIIVYYNENHEQCQPDQVAIRNACARAAGELSYVVLPYRLQLPPRGIWPIGNRDFGPYYLYACKDLLTKTILTSTLPTR